MTEIEVDTYTLGVAWVRVENALRRGPFAAYGVCIWPDLVPVLPYRVRVERTYRPLNRKNQQRERLEAEGQTLAEALDALAEQLEARVDA